jgi:general secretion pathway protein E
MGVAPYLVAATLRLALAQRLVRRLCRHCRTPRPLAVAEAVAFGMPQAAGVGVWDAKGCAWCKRTGYAGRIGLFEAFVPSGDDAAQLARGASAQSVGPGSSTLRADAAAKVLTGVTTPAEALAAVEGA